MDSDPVEPGNFFVQAGSGSGIILRNPAPDARPNLTFFVQKSVKLMYI
jgi:hypothetical protein